MFEAAITFRASKMMHFSTVDNWWIHQPSACDQEDSVGQLGTSRTGCRCRFTMRDLGFLLGFKPPGGGLAGRLTYRLRPTGCWSQNGMRTISRSGGRREGLTGIRRSNAKHEADREPKGGIENPLGLERIAFFSDAVMAIAITLLAIDLHVPDLAKAAAQAELPAWLSEMGPQIMSFVISFIVIGIYWLSHHRYFRFIKRYDNVVMLINLGFLLSVAVIPFTSGLLGRYSFLPVDVIAYAADVTAIGLSMSLLWWYASYRKRLIDSTVPPSVIRGMTLRAVVAPVVFLISIPVALASPFSAMASWSASPLVAVVAVRLASSRAKGCRGLYAG